MKCLGLGGTERQLVALLGALDRREVTPAVACLIKFGEYLEPLAALGLDPVEFPLRRALARPNTLVQAVRLAAWLRRGRAELLHCHDFYSNLVGSLAARLAGVPYVVSRRDVGAWMDPAKARVLAAVSRAAPLVLCNSEAARDLVIDREGVAPGRVRLVRNGLDLAAFDRLCVRAASGRVVILVANMKHELKGHETFLDAAAAVRRDVPDARFLLVGDGELRAGLEARARALGLGASVEFAGARTDVPALLGRATVAVSASSTEGSSNAVLEAMAAALPVVATRVGGTGELVRDGENGFLVPAGDARALATRLVELLQSTALGAQLGRAGRARVERDFSAARLARDVTDLYAELANRRGHARRAA